MKKFIVMGILMILSACMVGCGSESSKEDELVTSVSIQKDGTLKGIIVEEFDESYYNVAALTEMIQEAISDYDRQNSTAQIVLESCELVENDTKVKVVISYDSAQSYTDFNSETIFVGTVQEAYEAGYDMDLELYAVSDEKPLEPITKQEILNMGTEHIVIMEENMRVKCYGNILYIGKGVNLVSRKTADMENTDGLSALIFK